MIRISNRHHSDKQIAGPQVQFVDRIVEVPVETEPSIEHVHTHTERTIEVPVDRVVEVERVVHVQAPKVDLEPIYDKLLDLEGRLLIIAHNKNEFIKDASNELGMQSRALIAIKAQRDIDRNRRLMLIKRLKKERDALKNEQNAHKKMELKLKLAIGASLLLSIASLIVKL